MGRRCRSIVCFFPATLPAKFLTTKDTKHTKGFLADSFRVVRDFRGFIRRQNVRNQTAGTSDYPLQKHAQAWTRMQIENEAKTTFRELDKWLRRPVRACYWKQWRKSKTRLTKLRSLGVPCEVARGSAMSGKGLWRLSRTTAVQRTLTTEYLAEAGLFNLEEYWEKFASSRRTA